MSDEKNDVEQISLYLGMLVKMHAYSIINISEWKDKANGEKIYFLHQLGFSNEDIVVLVDTTIGTVKKEISVRKNKN